MAVYRPSIEKSHPNLVKICMPSDHVQIDGLSIKSVAKSILNISGRPLYICTLNGCLPAIHRKVIQNLVKLCMPSDYVQIMDCQSSLKIDFNISEDHFTFHTKWLFTGHP
jgi:hypothetical protein